MDTGQNTGAVASPEPQAAMDEAVTSLMNVYGQHLCDILIEGADLLGTRLSVTITVEPGVDEADVTFVIGREAAE